MDAVLHDGIFARPVGATVVVVVRVESCCHTVAYNLLLMTNVQHVRSILWGRMMFHSTITVIPPMGAQCARLLQCCVPLVRLCCDPHFFSAWLACAS